MTESFNGVGTGITSDGNSFLYELLSLLLNCRLSQGVFCEELDDRWRTEDSWYVLMTELFNGGGIDITGNYNLLIFEWNLLRLNHRLSRWVLLCLPWFFPVPLLWWLTVPLKRGMMNAIWVCGAVVCLLFFFRWPSKYESQISGATTAVMFEFTYQE